MLAQEVQMFPALCLEGRAAIYAPLRCALAYGSKETSFSRATRHDFARFACSWVAAQVAP